jgi:hypothetical protein
VHYFVFISFWNLFLAPDSDRWIGHTIYKKIHDSQIPFLGSNGFRLDLRPHKVYFFELSVKFYIKSSPIILKLVVDVKKEPKIRMGATRRNLFPKSKNQQDRLGTKSFTNPKAEVSKLNEKGRSGEPNFSGQTADGR